MLIPIINVCNHPPTDIKISMSIIVLYSLSKGEFRVPNRFTKIFKFTVLFIKIFHDFISTVLLMIYDFP